MCARRATSEETLVGAYRNEWLLAAYEEQHANDGSNVR